LRNLLIPVTSHCVARRFRCSRCGFLPPPSLGVVLSAIHGGHLCPPHGYLPQPGADGIFICHPKALRTRDCWGIIRRQKAGAGKTISGRSLTHPRFCVAKKKKGIENGGDDCRYPSHTLFRVKTRQRAYSHRPPSSGKMRKKLHPHPDRWTRFLRFSLTPYGPYERSHHFFPRPISIKIHTQLPASLAPQCGPGSRKRLLPPAGFFDTQPALVAGNCNFHGPQ